MSRKATKPGLLDVLMPVLVLVGCLVSIVITFGYDAGGYTQLCLIAAAATACVVGIKNGRSWHDMEEGMVHTVSAGLKAILILFTVGGLIGSWILAGTVPAMIYYGTQLLSPDWFYPATAVICAVVGLSIGSSWTVAGALGVGLMGISQVMGLSPAITAGAVISGAYLGDKLSPLSDTTNLAAGVTGNDLFHHIRHMTWTTLPAFAIALLVYTVVGWGAANGGIGDGLAEVNSILAQEFYLGLPVFLPLLLLMVLAFKRLPVLPILLAGIVTGVAVALVFQRQQVLTLASDDYELGMLLGLIKGIAIALIDGFTSESGNQMIDSLLSKGGMGSMLNTVFLIVCALSFGGAFEKAGLLQRLVELILTLVRGTGSLIMATLATCIGTNFICADQYIAIVVPSRMYHKIYQTKGLHQLNLSRAVEDAGTLTSVLIPWNTCGLFMAGTLGVTAWGWGSDIGAFAYAPWAILNWLSPIISAIYGFVGFRILTQAPEPDPV